ncbi:MAG: thermonuclease family protein [Pseudomonadota bacterium]
MARRSHAFRSQPGSRRTRHNRVVSRATEARISTLAILLALLAGWNLNAWLWPETTMVPSAAAPTAWSDPWAVSRQQRQLLEAQEGPPAPIAATGSAASVPGRGGSFRFASCAGGARYTCVVDGDTFWLEGQKIRVADIDTPEISSPRCDAEFQLGQRAKQRMQQLLNAGPIALEPADRATDRYGRALFRVTRNGTSLGETLVGEGLAVWYGGGKPNWC